MSTRTGSYLIIGGSPEDQQKAISSLLPATSLQVYQSTNHPDLIFIDYPDSLSIGIEQIRTLQQRLTLSPTVLEQKIALIKDAHKLTIEAQNALLKTLEEVPADAVIILCTSSKELLLPTIQSRCFLVNLKEQSTQVSDEELKKITKLIAEVDKWGIGGRFKFAADISKDRQTALEFLVKVLVLIHQKILVQSPIQSRLYKQIHTAKTHLEANTNVRLTMENLLLNW